jgi:hypothetical protein
VAGCGNTPGLTVVLPGITPLPSSVSVGGGGGGNQRVPLVGVMVGEMGVVVAGATVPYVGGDSGAVTLDEKKTC